MNPRFALRSLGEKKLNFVLKSFYCSLRPTSKHLTPFWRRECLASSPTSSNAAWTPNSTSLIGSSLCIGENLAMRNVDGCDLGADFLVLALAGAFLSRWICASGTSSYATVKPPSSWRVLESCGCTRSACFYAISITSPHSSLDRCPSPCRLTSWQIACSH